MKVPDLYIGKRLFCGSGNPIALGLGPTEARGSCYFEGPVIMGDPGSFPIVNATVMIGPNINSESSVPVILGGLCTPLHNPYSLCVTGDAAIFDNLDVQSNIAAGSNIIAQGEVMSRCGGHILSAKKNFDIPHPTKEGWRLRHTCPEGPSHDVYVRGKIKGSDIIELPEYWIGFVDPESITVSLTAIGSYQNVIVEKIENNKVYLKSETSINCHYHIFAERIDGEKLIAEYEGDTPADYPGNNQEYSVSGFHYDIKE